MWQMQTCANMCKPSQESEISASPTCLPPQKTFSVCMTLGENKVSVGLPRSGIALSLQAACPAHRLQDTPCNEGFPSPQNTSLCLLGS